MTRRRSNAGLFERLRSPSSVSYRGELQRRRKQARAEAMRQKEAEREAIRREREQIREANRLKRKMMAEERREAAREKKERAKEAARSFPTKAELSGAYRRGAGSLNEALEMLGYSRINPRGKKGRFARCVKAVSERGGAVDPKAVCGAQERKYRKGKTNPADAAVAVSEEFHGRKVREMVPVQQKRHYHKYLAELGELRKLEVVTRDGKHKVTLSKFQKARLCSNEDRNQLFLVGGDQSVNLKDFGISHPHETETLGEVTRIEYFTDKEHLGSEGGTAVYVHKFRSTNDNGRHKTVRMARNPDLIYHLRDEHLEFSGGSYEIKAEGIDL